MSENATFCFHRKWEDVGEPERWTERWWRQPIRCLNCGARSWRKVEGGTP